jgi:carbon monoxide dehydrogenase subunit G
MEIDKSVTINATIDRVWEMIFDTQVLQACIPGMESIERKSDTEYRAQIKVKISFITARFKIRCNILEMVSPTYMCAKGVGDDSSVTSSLKALTTVFLAEAGDNRTELKLHVKVEVFGRLGTLGLSAIKTKADRMWEEFCRNLSSHIEAATAGRDRTALSVESARARPDRPE